MKSLILIHATTTRFGIGLVFFALLLGGCGGGGYGGGGYGGGGYMMPATVTSITITPASAIVINGTTARLTAVGSYSDGTTADITTQVSWTSVTPTTASVGSYTGLVTGNAVGTTTITAAMNASTYGVIASSPVSVFVTGATLTGITVTPLTMSIAKGSTTIFTATGNFSDSTTGNVSGSASWGSSDTTAATINGSGIATGVGAGSSTITATLNAISNTATLTVN